MGLTKITSRILDSSGVTILGTIATGVWQGTPINQTYLVGQSGTNTGDETLARINALDVTELGTISSGVWNGTAINQTYLVGQSGTNTGDETLARINALDVTELGTISSGVWQGSVIASAYLDADTAHLNAVQTFTGAKTFSGNVRIGTGTNHALFAADGVYVQGSQNGYLVSPADWRFYSGGTLKMTLQSGGNVGIGITPSYKLDVGGSSAVLRVKETSGTDVRIVSGGSIGYIGTYTNHELRLLTNGTEKLTISSGGVITTGGAVDNPFKITANPGTRSLKLTSNSTNFGTFISWLRASETYEKAYLGFTSTSDDVFEINNRENADMTFHTHTNERMRILATGNILIGATNLDVGGSVPGIRLGSNGSAIFAVDYANPPHYSSPMSVDRRNTSGDGNMYTMWRQGIFKGAMGITGNDIVFKTGNNSSDAERMRITSGGAATFTSTENYSSSGYRKYIVINSADQGGGGILWKKQSSTYNRAILANQGNFYITRSTADDNSAALLTDFTISPGGNVLIGATSDITGTHYINKSVAANAGILYVGSSTTGRFSLVVQASDSGYNNSPATCLKVGGTSSTSRSISAAGTVNVSGNDYAEYMTKAITDNISKGDVVGINSDGLLTNIFSDAISFVIKSTDPSFVGGDIWGIESEDKDDIEEARIKVDRIAFSGQVPCNVTGASVGDYIIPVASSDGKITGEAVSNPTFEQYKMSVGKVWKIMKNGNSWVAVKIG